MITLDLAEFWLEKVFNSRVVVLCVLACASCNITLASTDSTSPKASVNWYITLESGHQSVNDKCILIQGSAYRCCRIFNVKNDYQFISVNVYTPTYLHSKDGNKNKCQCAERILICINMWLYRSCLCLWAVWSLHWFCVASGKSLSWETIHIPVSANTSFLQITALQKPASSSNVSYQNKTISNPENGKLDYCVPWMPSCIDVFWTINPRQT